MVTYLHTAAKQALEALEHMLEDAKQDRVTVEYWNECVDAITALREALVEQPAQEEPVAWPADMLERIDAAIKRITSGHGLMRVPPDKTDPDLVLAEIRNLIKSSRPQAREPNQKPWCPDVCPITGLPFFMWIEHHETGQEVPTYGGPYDSYTIPVREKDGSYCRERYDHDRGGWLTDEIEDVGVQIVSDQAFVYEDERPQAREPLTDEQRVKLRDAFAQALTSVYVCGRVWEAWQHGTMSEGDFQPAGECGEVLDSLVEAAHGIKGDA